MIVTNSENDKPKSPDRCDICQGYIAEGQQRGWKSKGTEQVACHAECLDNEIIRNAEIRARKRGRFVG